MVLYLGWIVAAFLAGLLLGKLPKKQRKTLQERFDRLNFCAGLSYVEILRRVEAVPQMIDRNADGETERTWVDAGYSITLAFDRQDICLGVMEEWMDREVA